MCEFKAGDKVLMEVEIVNKSTDNNWYTIQHPYGDKTLIQAVKSVDKIHPFVDENKIKEQVCQEYRNLLLQVLDCDDDVLQYIMQNNLPIASVYGDIAQDKKGKFTTTGVARTGCIFCCYGCHLEKEPNRFQRLKTTHPHIYEYCMKSVSNGGLGLKEVLDFIGVKSE